MLCRLSPTKGVKGDPRRLQCISIFPSPHPLSSRKLKKAFKLPSHRYLPTPTTFHFLLPTFSPRFLPPPYFFRPFLPPPYCVPLPSIVDLIFVRSSIQQQQSPRLRFRRKYPYWHINYAVKIHPQHRPSRVSKHKLSL